jgi:hypothetical protein
VDFDAQEFSAFSATKYIIELSNAAKTQFKAFEMFASKTGAGVSDQIYSRFPGGLNLSVNLVQVATEVRLRITNGEAFTVSASIAKTQL